MNTQQRGLVAGAVQGLVSSLVSGGIGTSGGGSGGAPAFDPASLFGSGEAGGAWAMTAANLRQLSGGTGTVANGDPVGYVLDLSGNGKHLTQAVSGQRPLYAVSGGVTYIDFDGVDDILSTASLTMSTTDQTTLIIAWAPVSVTGAIQPISARTWSGPGSWSVYAGIFGANRLDFQLNSGAQFITGVSGATRVVHSMTMDRAAGTVAAQIVLQENGIRVGTPTGVLSSGSNADYIFDVGSANGFLVSGMEVSAILLINRVLTAQELLDAETWAAGFAGVTF